MSIIAQTGQTIEMIAPQWWVPYAAMLLPVVRQILSTIVPGADTSVRKAVTAVGLSILVGVLNALADGAPDDLNSIALVTMGVAITQLASYELVFKRLIAKTLRDDLTVLPDPATESEDIGVDGD